MKKNQLTVQIFTLFIVIVGLTMCSPKKVTDEEILSLRRGKVSSSQTNILNLKLNEASMFNPSIEIDSVFIKCYFVWDIDNGEHLQMIDRKFPKKFVFGTDIRGDTVYFKKNKKKAKVKYFFKNPKP